MTETRKRERENNFMVLDDEDDDIVEFSKRKQPTFPALAEFLESNHSKKPRIDESSQIYSNQSSIAIDRRTTLANTTPGDEIFSMQEDLQYPDSPKAAPTTHSTNRKPIDTNNSEEVVRELSLIDGEEDNVPSLSAYYEEQVKNRAQSSLAASLEIEPLDLLSEFGSTSASVTRQPLFSTQSKQTHNYSRPPVSGSYITANCPLTGKILYLPRIQKSKQKSDVVNKIKRGSLLAKPVTLMTKEIEAAEREQKLREENERRILEKRKKKKHNKAKTEQLWVEKYKPRAFIDLLGDQRVNREVLKWIKEWDYCVFGKMPPAESDREKAMRRYKSVFGNGAASRRLEMNDKPKDRLLRPEKKILLLSGPPGFGKTTLAHVAAAHAGYNIIEINASDDRTGEAVKSKVKAALEMQAIVKHTDTGKDGKEDVKMQQKPNFLIIDEIDGASSSGGSDSFIKQLVQLATADIPNEDERDGTNRKGKGKRAAPLLRPIICICNDAYAPVLRPLRAVAQHIQFRKVPILTIGKRLQEICEEEDLETDLRTLCVLAESTDGDIRSCLHTLQFIRGKSDTFSREMLKEAGLGQKDTAKSLFAIWEELFCAIDARNFSSMQTMDSKQRYLNRLLQTISSSGEHERIMQGCFEAYLNMRFNDVAGKKIVMMSDWLDFYDHLNYRANELHDYSVYGYLPFPIINFHRFFAASVIQDHRVEYPRVEYEKFVSKRSHENLVNVFLEGINPAQRRALHKDIVVTELIPRLLRIISPDLRPVNKQLIKPAEVAVLSRVVEIMIEFGLTFIQDKNEDGQFVYKLEPPIEQIMNFEAFGIKSVLTNKYAVRQLVSQEIEAEILRRREAALEAKGANASIKAKNAITIQETIKQASKEAIKPQVAKDFFGRPIQPDAAPRRNKQVEVSKVPVAYRYHEGFSNAVRKPMTVSMFL